MARRIAQAVVLAIILACGDSGREVAAAPVDCNALPAELTGTLVGREKHGPPGWGETPARDSPWTLYALVLAPASASVAARLLSSCARAQIVVTEVQLWMTGGDSGPLKRLTNQQVRVVGSLHVANGPPGEVLPVQFEVTGITAQE